MNITRVFRWLPSLAVVVVASACAEAEGRDRSRAMASRRSGTLGGTATLTAKLPAA